VAALGEQSTGTCDAVGTVRQISDLTVITTIGVGGFGRVELVIQI
jgi:hypothetical protein